MKPDLVTRAVRRIFDRVTPEYFFAFVGTVILVIIFAGVADCVFTQRIRGGAIACNRWIAECTFHNNYPVCLAKARELGCTELSE